MTNETRIHADPNLPTLVIEREFDAPPERVFQAHVDPELVARWLGPRDLEMRIDAWQPSTGGHYRYAAVRGGEEIAAFYGSFHEVRDNQRLVQTFTWLGQPDGTSLDTTTFEALEGGRTRLRTVSVVDSLAARDAALASGMQTGVVEGYQKLDQLLAND